jgi:hypothetical protein
MRLHVYLSASIALLAFFSALNGEEAKPSPQGQLRLLISPGETTQTITRPRDDQKAQKRELIISCDSMMFDQGAYVFKNGTLEIASGYLSFAEIALTFSGNSISISSPTPNAGLKEIHFQVKPGEAMPNVLAAPAPR